MQNLNEAIEILTHGVYVIGVHTPEKDNLMTAAWLCQVSGKPPMIAVAVSASHLTAELIVQAGGFSVSVLKSEQREIALRNGTVSGRKKDKLANTLVHAAGNGHPVIDGAAAFLECCVTESVYVGDHVIFIAEVIAGERFSDDVMIYQKKKFFP